MLLPKRKKKKKKATRRIPCAHAHGHFCQSRKNAFPLPIIYFPSFPSKYIPFFFLIFSPNFSIHPISPQNIHTLKPETLNNVNIFFKRKHCEFVGKPSHAMYEM